MIRVERIRQLAERALTEKVVINSAKLRQEYNAALLAYAAMVERCEETLKCNFVAQDGRTTINSAVKAQVNYILKGATDEET